MDQVGIDRSPRCSNPRQKAYVERAVIPLRELTGQVGVADNGSQTVGCQSALACIDNAAGRAAVRATDSSRSLAGDVATCVSASDQYAAPAPPSSSLLPLPAVDRAVILPCSRPPTRPPVISLICDWARFFPSHLIYPQKWRA